MKKTILSRCLAGAMALILLAGCTQDSAPSRYRYQFMDTFDTLVETVGYARTDGEFDRFADTLHERFRHYHKLFDRYESYDGINNIKTINDNAGITPVEVEREIIDLLLLAKEWERSTDGSVNVAMGSVLEIWHNFRELYSMGDEGDIPDMAVLRSAAEHCDINKLIIDEENSTVFLSEAGMKLDVGALAKGYATELVCQELYDMGFTSFIISSGGNVRLMDPPLDETKSAWVIGIQNPHGPMNVNDYIDSVVAHSTSIVTSGNYQRFYMHEGRRIHHIVDANTLMPADRYSSVTVVVENSGVADMLSTALYILPKSRGEELAREYGAEVMWIYENGDIEYTEGLLPMLKQAGGATSVVYTDGE